MKYNDSPTMILDRAFRYILLVPCFNPLQASGKTQALFILDVVTFGEPEDLL